MSDNKFFGIFLLYVMIWLAAVIGIVYVAIHFITKFW